MPIPSDITQSLYKQSPKLKIAKSSFYSYVDQAYIAGQIAAYEAVISTMVKEHDLDKEVLRGEFHIALTKAGQDFKKYYPKFQVSLDRTIALDNHYASN